MPPNPPNGKKTTHGPMQACPCPRCGVPNDFRETTKDDLAELEDEPVKGKIEDEPMAGLDIGAVMGCDHCHGYFRIEDMKKTIVLKLAPCDPPAEESDEDTADAG